MPAEAPRHSFPSVLPGLGAALCLGLATSSPGGTPPPTPSAVLALVRAATGGEAWDRVLTLRCTAEIEANGLKGTQTTLEDTRTGAWVHRLEMNMLSSTEGFDGQEAWIQDRSGRSLPIRSVAGRREVVNASFAACKALLFPGRRRARLGPVQMRNEAGRRFWVVDVEPRGGIRFSVWVDSRSRLPCRLTSTGNGQSTTIQMDDYRQTEGLKLPFRIRSSHGNDPPSLWRCTCVEVNPEVDPRVFARPPAPPPDFGLDEDACETRVPMAPGQGAQVFLRTCLNGRGPYWFCLDSGCSTSCMTPRVAAEIGSIPAGYAREDGVGAARGSVRFCIVDRLQVGSAWMRNMAWVVSPGLEVIGNVQGEPCAGLLGSDLFQRFVVKLDYVRGEVGLALPEAFMPPAGLPGIPIAFWQGIPQVEGSLDGRKGVLNLDSGSDGTLDVFRPFVLRHNLKRRSGRLIRDLDFVGIGGETTSYAARAREIRVGNAVLARPVISLNLSRQGAFSWMEGLGNLGGGFLERFDVTFDYPREQVFLQPNANHGKPFAFSNRHGIQAIQEDPAGLRIGRVIPQSPASEAGLKTGDLIVGIQGRRTPALTLDQARERLRAPAGSRVVLDVRRGRKSLRVRLVLRDLL